MQPTDVVLNFGTWLRKTNSSCGAVEGESKCPHILWVCEFLTGEHPFKTWWFTTIQGIVDGVVVNEIPDSHHLHMPARCQLSPSQVVDRKEVIGILQPDPLRQPELWVDGVHVHAESNHGFNRQFVGRLPKVVTKAPQVHHLQSIWKHMLARGR